MACVRSQDTGYIDLCTIKVFCNTDFTSYSIIRQSRKYLMTPIPYKLNPGVQCYFYSVARISGSLATTDP